VTNDVVLESKHHLFRSKRFQKNNFLEVSQLGFPVEREQYLLWIFRRCPLFPCFLMLFKGLNDAFKLFDVKLSAVDDIVSQLR